MKLIDVDALIERLKSYAHRYDDDDEIPYSFIYDGFIYEIKQEPTLDAVPVRHGNFVGTEYDGYADGNPVYYEWKCSECGCVFEDEEPAYRYCPQCGARMDKDETD